MAFQFCRKFATLGALQEMPAEWKEYADAIFSLVPRGARSSRLVEKWASISSQSQMLQVRYLASQGSCFTSVVPRNGYRELGELSHGLQPKIEEWGWSGSGMLQMKFTNAGESMLTVYQTRFGNRYGDITTQSISN